MSERSYGLPEYLTGARHAEDLHLGGMRLPDEPGFDIPDDAERDPGKEPATEEQVEEVLKTVGESLAAGMEFSPGAENEAEETAENGMGLEEMERRLNEFRQTYFSALRNLAESIPDREGKIGIDGGGDLARLAELSEEEEGGKESKKGTNLLKGLIVTLMLSGGGQVIGVKDAEAAPNHRKSIIEQSFHNNMRSFERRVANKIFSIPDRALTNAEQVARQQETFNRNAMRVIHGYDSEMARLDNRYIIQESRGEDLSKLNMEKQRDILNIATKYLQQTENMADNRMNGVGIPHELDRFHTRIVNLIQETRDSLRNPSRAHGYDGQAPTSSVRDREEVRKYDAPHPGENRRDVRVDDLDVILNRGR
ncbi:MAG: hypothetical protein HGA31_05110 [Candidatus Moranbacteria bacterium]|nr:hypothetical protein [Candidatus Moranbacteria bacterium]